MQIISIDGETGLIRPGCQAPELVCLTAQVSGCDPVFVELAATEKWITDAIMSSAAIICGHNVSYDMSVLGAAFPSLLPTLFKAYAEDRVTDTMVRQRLLDTASGGYRLVEEGGRYIKRGYSLQDLARRAGQTVKKEGFRLFYGLFSGIPLSQWNTYARKLQARGKAVLEGVFDPAFDDLRKIIADDERFKKELRGMVEADPQEVTTYPLEDARVTLAVYEWQEVHADFLEDQYRQTRAELALKLCTAWGMKTDPKAVHRLKQDIVQEFQELEAELKKIGLVKANGVRDTKAAKALMVKVCREAGIPIRRTDGHSGDDAKCKDIQGNLLSPEDDECVEHVTLDEDACKATEDETLISYAELSTLKKVLSNDLEMLAKGEIYPVHPSYGFAETGRTTSSKPNIQQVGKRPGIRECFIPRPGRVFMQADFPALEAYTWAQCCVSWLGQSKLGEALNAGLDPHLAMAANMLGVSYEEAERRLIADEQETADLRQLAKIANFGFSGGMGPPKLLVSAKKQLKPEVVARLGLDLERMKRLKDEWRATWPEADAYFALIKSFGPEYPERYTATVESLFTKRFRGGAGYCAACNNGFQALGSDCAKQAAWLICCAQYNDPKSPLFNSRTVAFIHDEFVAETDDNANAHDAAHEMARLMVEGANTYLPDVPIPLSKLKPLLMRRWSKKAQPLKDASGRLIPWQSN